MAGMYVDSKTEADMLIVDFRAGIYEKVGIDEIRAHLRKRKYTDAQIGRMEEHVCRFFVYGVAR